MKVLSVSSIISFSVEGWILCWICIISKLTKFDTNANMCSPLDGVIYLLANLPFRQANDGFIMWQRVTTAAPTCEIKIAGRHSRDGLQCFWRRQINETLEERIRRRSLLLHINSRDSFPVGSATRDPIERYYFTASITMFITRWIYARALCPF